MKFMYIPGALPGHARRTMQGERTVFERSGRVEYVYLQAEFQASLFSCWACRTQRNVNGVIGDD